MYTFTIIDFFKKIGNTGILFPIQNQKKIQNLPFPAEEQIPVRRASQDPAGQPIQPSRTTGI
jgi:hypothetical protein